MPVSKAWSIVEHMSSKNLQEFKACKIVSSTWRTGHFLERVHYHSHIYTFSVPCMDCKIRSHTFSSTQSHHHISQSYGRESNTWTSSVVGGRGFGHGHG